MLSSLFLLLNITLATCGNVTSSSRKLPPLGRSMRQEFYMEPDLIQLNHGSYGTYPKVVGNALREYQIRSEKNPDLWIRREVKSALANVRKLLGNLMNADSEDIVMVPNTTSGITAILRSMVFAIGERILHFNTIYGGIEKIVQYVIDSNGGNVSRAVFNVTYPMNNSDFLAKFESFLDEIYDPLRPIRIALIDHITSVPAVVLPIHQIIPMLKQRNITVLIDGAHAIGQVPIDITSLDPDYYVTNCHKWLFAARGCAALYVKKSSQNSVHPALISFGYNRPSNFQEEFFWTGTMDYSQYLTVPTALQFRKDCGGEEVIRMYNHNLALSGGALMAAKFGTRVLQNPDQMGSMVDVQLPIDDPENPRINVAEWWVDEQLYRHPNIFSPVYKHNGVWWVRVSAQIYNDISDFEKSANHFMTICEEVNGSSQNSTENS